MIKLPPPDYENKFPLNEALQKRRSVREYADQPISLKDAAQLLWAGQGATSVGGFRTAPSAGALYPLELYLVAGRVEGLEPGVYRYDPKQHTLTPAGAGDIRADLAAASLDQSWMARAPAMLAVSAVAVRTTGRYGDRGHRYVFMDAGHAAENVLLEAVALGLGGVVVGAFSDHDVKRILKLNDGEDPLYLIPVGRR